MIEPEVTILLVNYKTPDLTKLCLRLLNKYTDRSNYRLIVVDNDSGDASLDYLKSLSGIELIERPRVDGENGPTSHSNAVDLVFPKVTTPFVLLIHTDTFVTDSKWLPFLLAQIKQDENIAGVGSWKLESKPLIKRLLKKIERFFQILFYRVTGKTNHYLSGVGKNSYYLRSHCAMYRTDLIRKHQLKFLSQQGSFGKEMHEKLVSHGYDMKFIRSEVLSQYMDHLNHATVVLNPQLGSRKKTIKQGLKRIKRRLRQMNANAILQDASLDFHQ